MYTFLFNDRDRRSHYPLMKKILPGCLLFTGLFFSLIGNAAAGETENSSLPSNGIAVHIRQAELATAKDENTPDALNVTIDFINTSSTQKIDLSTEVGYALVDEFGNQYRRLSDETASTAPRNKHYPSLYPNEKFTQVIAFEPPVEKSQRLELIISAPMWGESGSVKLLLPFRSGEKKQDTLPPMEKVEPSQPVQPPEPPVTTPIRMPQQDDLKILYPSPGQKVKPGDSVFMRISLADDLPPPDEIRLYSPTSSFEDPGRAMRYDVRIPADQAPGPFTIVVLAVWGKEEIERTVSNSFTVEVVNKSNGCPENCPQIPVEKESQ